MITVPGSVELDEYGGIFLEEGIEICVCENNNSLILQIRHVSNINRYMYSIPARS